jgi:hypothetical protein
MTREEAMMRLTLAYGHHPAVADFNIVAVNHVLDLMIENEREACAKACEDEDVAPTDDAIGVQRCIADAIRARSKA